VNVDVNGNGIKDAVDTNGIADATIVLRNAASNVVATVVTPASGAFSFANLPPGTYTLIETNASGWVSTSPDQLAATLTSGQASAGNVFLDKQAATVSNKGTLIVLR